MWYKEKLQIGGRDLNEENTSIYDEKLSRIEAEIKRLNTLFRGEKAKIKKAGESLIRRAAFMRITLEDLEESITLNGTTSTYKNGENQFGTKISPEVQTYNSMIKNYSGVMKQITDLLPQNKEKQGQSTSLPAFINSRET